MLSYFNKVFLNIKTGILMMLPIGLYIWILKRHSPDRLQDYSGIMGRNPRSYIVYHDVVLVDLSDMVL